MERFLAKTTYRAIMKHAVAIDSDAALRAVLVAFPCSFYDPRQQQWTAVDARQEWLASRRAVDDFVRELNGSSDWYLPHRVEALVAQRRLQQQQNQQQHGLAKSGKKKKSKKAAAAAQQAEALIGALPSSASPSSSSSSSHPPHPSFAFLSEEAAGHVRRLYRTTPLTTQNLNNAFATVKMLSYVMQMQKRLPSHEGELILPDPRNLSGFSILKEGIHPINDPSLMGAGEEEAAELEHIRKAAKADSPALAEAKRIVAEREGRTVAADEDLGAEKAAASGSNTTGTPDEDKKASSTAAINTSPTASPPTPSSFGLQLLVAHPLMSGFFRHSIIMLSQAGKGGALGFIINKPVVNDDGQLMPVWSFIPDVVHPVFSTHLKNNVVFIGGPVASPASSSHALFIIHRIAGLTGSILLGDGVYISNDFNSVHKALEEKRATAEEVMVLLGYSGWGDGQLEHEERKGSWVVLKREWDHKDAKGLARHQSTADYIFSKNVVVESSRNIPRSVSEPLRVAKKNTTAGSNASKKKADGADGAADPPMSPLADSTACSAVGEPRLSWVSLFGSLGPKYRSMARLADVRVDPYDSELYEGGVPRDE